MNSNEITVNQEDKKYLENYNVHNYEVPLTSVDIVIFSLIKGQLSVLIVARDESPYKDKWALPGGFIDLQQDKDIEASAYRKLVQKTGVQSPYLEQVESIGNCTRDIRGWSVTVLYYALIGIEKVVMNGSNLSNRQKSRWITVEKAMKAELAFDHALLVKKAWARLCEKTRYTALPIELMPELFTLTELQKTFEIILGSKLPVKSFRKRIVDADIVAATSKSKLSGKRHAQLFKSTGVDRDYYFPRALII